MERISRESLCLALEALGFEQERLQNQLDAGHLKNLEKPARARLDKMWQARLQIAGFLHDTPDPVQETPQGEPQ